MIKQILHDAGIPARESRYPDPPAGTFAVYFDDIETDGPDGLNWLLYHNGTVELYEAKKDPASEKALEAQLDARGLHYEKQSRYWLASAQRYQVIYEFTIIEKGGHEHV